MNNSFYKEPVSSGKWIMLTHNYMICIVLFEVGKGRFNNLEEAKGYSATSKLPIYVRTFGNKVHPIENVFAWGKDEIFATTHCMKAEIFYKIYYPKAWEKWKKIRQDAQEHGAKLHRRFAKDVKDGTFQWPSNKE